MTTIVVFYMGLAGSSTVIEACRKLGFAAGRAYNVLEPAQCGCQHVISLVRDPVARNVSTFFYDKARILAETGEGYSDVLLQEFLISWDGHDRPLTWFQECFQAETGIDVYAEKFNRKRGWSVYETGSEWIPGKRVLVIRTEDLQPELLAGMAALLEVQIIESVEGIERRGEDAVRYGEAVGGVYREFMRRAVMPEAYLERMYGSDYAKHFWYAKELAAFREFWSAPR